MNTLIAYNIAWDFQSRATSLWDVHVLFYILYGMSNDINYVTTSRSYSTGHFWSEMSYKHWWNSLWLWRYVYLKCSFTWKLFLFIYLFIYLFTGKRLYNSVYSTVWQKKLYFYFIKCSKWQLSAWMRILIRSPTEI